jgi:hypothetical protein
MKSTSTKVPPYWQEDIKGYFDTTLIYIQGLKIDIIGGSDTDWFKLGYCIATTFGEDGRSAFKLLSNLRGEVDEKLTDLKYDRCNECLGRYNISINFFFYMANKAFYKELGMSVRGFAFFSI